ncbi:MAG: thiamine pyrophosphate-binding protein [Microbacterium sp.]|uniref:thiamine pyrophosphate-binding protein n=1 Tax=Microbacterium sp. TaxID=51671 RepID=UPI0039E6D704
MTAPAERRTTESDGQVRGADLLVETLVSAGVKEIFGLPGDTGVVFYDALNDHRDDIVHVLTRDERHALAMADAYSRTTGRVGVAEVSSGGGCSYAVGSMGESYAAGIPVLLITSDIHTASRGSGALTEIDQVKLFSAVTKFSRVVERPADIPAAVADALRAATTGRPAPVVLIFPEDVLDHTIARDELTDAAIPSVEDLPAERPAAATDVVQAAVAAIARAKRPAIVAGSGVHTSSAAAELRALAERVGAPVATSIHGKGVIADDDPYSLGVVGNNGARRYAFDYVASADTVIFVGTRANATNTDSWRAPRREPDVTVIHIDIDATRAGRNYPGSLAVVGDSRTVLRQLLDALEGVDLAVDRDAVVAEVAAARRAWKEAGVPTSTEAGKLSPADVVTRVQAVFGSEVVAVGDPGTPTPYLASFWELDKPGRTVVLPRGHGAMGYAIPAAMGAAIGTGGRVVCFTADGSFAMACGELETAARYQLPVLFIEFDNASYGWIKMLQHLYMGQRYFGVTPGAIDAVKVAEACGVPGADVRTLDELEIELRAARDRQGPTFLSIRVPHVIDQLPPVSAWDVPESGEVVRPVY